MTIEERSELLYNKYSKDYLRFLIQGYLKQDNNQYWEQIAKQLKQMYNEK